MKKALPTRYDIVEFSKSEHSLDRIRSNDGGADPLSPVPSQNSCRKQSTKILQLLKLLNAPCTKLFQNSVSSFEKQCGS